jgi:Domain of unknown function (DUF4386)
LPRYYPGTPNVTTALIDRTPDKSQCAAARIVGGTYLLTNATAFFQNLYVLPHLVDYKSAATTTTNIVNNELLFRLGYASDLLTFSVLVVLISALYIVFRPVYRNLALVAVSWRLVETAIMITVALQSSLVLRLIDGAGQRTGEIDRLQTLVLSALHTQSDQYVVGYFFLGLGSTLFSYLWLRSGYVPVLLAWWGLIGSALCAVASLVFIVFPHASSLVWYLPIGTFELAMGFWLSIRGIRLRNAPLT